MVSSVVVGDRDSYIVSGYRSVVGSANYVGHSGRVGNCIIILLDRNCDGLRDAPILRRESQGGRIGRHVGVGGVAEVPPSSIVREDSERITAGVSLSVTETVTPGADTPS